jgi:hypothetical protein
MAEAPPGLAEAVTSAGRHLIGLIRRGNAMTVEQDPAYEWAAEISQRFDSWMVAVRALRKKGAGDFTLELGEMLVLSRVREDSYVMQMDVRRVASYYMHQWAGLAPVAGDPKPGG